MLHLQHLPANERAFEISLRKTKPDILLAEFGVVGADCLRVAQKVNVPMAIHFHGFDASEYQVLKDFKDAYERMFAYARVIFVVSEVMKKKLIALGAPPEKLVLTHYGPHSSYMQVTPDFKQKKILAVGRMVDKKAPHLLLLAFRKCLERHPEARLIYVGQGPLFRLVSELTKHLNLEQHVHYAGVAGRDVIQQEMLSARCFVQHSRTAENGDMEGTPVAIIEAQAAGLPVISTIHAGIPDIVAHGETGFLVEEGDVDGMAGYLDKILTDSALAQQLGQNARERIRENFTIEHHIRAIDAALELAVQNKR